MAETAPAGGEVDAAAAQAQWAELMAAYQKQAGQAMSAAAPFMAGGMPFASMPFAQPYMFPSAAALMFPGMAGFNPAAFPMPTGADGAAETKAENGVSEVKTEATEEEEEEEAAEGKQNSEGPKTRKRSGALTRAASVPSGKKPKAEGGLGVKSNSSAALAMLAGAAAGKNPAAGAQAAAAAAAAVAAQAANNNTPAAAAPADVWAGMMGSATAALGSAQDIKITAEQAQLMGITDERELKRLRRKQSNRESARRSRLRKQAECEALARQVKDLITENSKLKEEKLQLLAQIEILNAKLSMSTFGAVHALGQGELEKIQAELRKQTEAQQASMAAALAQVNATIAANGEGAGDEKESQSDADD